MTVTKVHLYFATKSKQEKVILMIDRNIVSNIYECILQFKVSKDTWF